MLTASSPYACVAASYRDNGYSVMPIMPGTKVPGRHTASGWDNMPGWQRYCDAMAPEFVHDGWERWPEAGVCVAHGAVVGLDLDTDRQDVAEALHRAVTPPSVRRRGQKGWLGYFRPGVGLEGETARVRWYDPKVLGSDGAPSRSPVVEVLLHGTQSVLPPSIHPDTGKPYRWLTPDTLEDTALDELEELSGDDLAALDREFAKIGLTRQAPRRARISEFDRPEASGHDLEKPFGRSLNDRALEAIDAWWPDLQMPKSRRRGAGAWEAVPFWRVSGSGRPLQDRNANLKATPRGIVDYGRHEGYTPVDVVMAARDCDFQAAASWLADYVRPEEGASNVQELHTAPKPAPKRKTAVVDYDAPTLQMLTGQGAARMPEVAHMADGVLAKTNAYMREAMRRDWPEAAFLVALNVTGVAIGRSYSTWTNLRSNLYTVVLAGSGWGKSSIYSPAVELLIQAGLKDEIGAERVKSDSGLIKEIFSHPRHRKIYFLDEFGHILQRCTEKGAGGHMKAILTELTNLYSKAGSFYAGSAYADGSRQSQMYCPHVNVFGMATPGQFWAAFGSGAIEDGTLPRFSILKAAGRPPRRKLDADHLDTVGAMRDALAPDLSELGAITHSTGNLSVMEPLRVQPTPQADEAWSEIEERAEALAIEAETKGGDRDYGGVLARVAETAGKIALIFAVSRAPAAPRIEERDVAAGRKLAWFFAHVAMEGIAVHVADSTHQAAAQKMLDFIRAGAEAGRTRKEIARKFRVTGRENDETLAMLIDAEEIIMDSSAPEGGGPVRKTYFAI